MSIIPASRLSMSDFSRLGNNLVGPRRRSPKRQARRQLVDAVNRSLACIDERVSQLHRPIMAS